VEQPRQSEAKALDRHADYGGQALIEGIMMRSREWLVIGLLGASGEITLLHKRIDPWYAHNKLTRLPFIRGLFAMYDTLVEGYKALELSANATLSEEEQKPLSPWAMAGTLLLALVLGLGLFVALPNLLVSFFDKRITNVWLLNLAEGGIRLLIFFLYVAGISLMPHIRRVFAFHGAEHKTINAYEAGEPLEPEHIKPYSTLHPRCGTNFLFLVIVVGILIFALTGWQQEWYLRIAWRLVVTPVVVALSYEVLKVAGRFRDNFFGKLLAAPGMAFQKLTTREPDTDQLRLAAAALKELIALVEGKAPSSQPVEAYLASKAKDPVDGGTGPAQTET